MTPELDDGYAEAAADNRAGELAAYYEQAQAEADAEAWGGRGPSASYAEWAAEGREPEAGS